MENTIPGTLNRQRITGVRIIVTPVLLSRRVPLIVQVDKIGASTEYGKIGIGVASAAADGITPLQKQTGKPCKNLCHHCGEYCLHLWAYLLGSIFPIILFLTA